VSETAPSAPVPGDAVPLVSIVMSARNHAAFVTAALDSIAAQTHPRIELIVIDDGSTDGTAEAIAAWLAGLTRPMRVAFHRQPHRGLGITLARALALAEGAFVQFLASDDALFAGMTARLAAVLAAADETVAAVACDGYVFDGRAGPHQPFGRLHPAPPGRNQHRELMVGNWLPAMGLLYRRSALLEAGGIDPDLAYEDWGLLLALTRRRRIERIPDRLFLYRRHRANTSEDMQRMRAALQALGARYPDMMRVRAWRAAIAAGDLRGILAGLTPGNADLALRFGLRRLLRSLGAMADWRTMTAPPVRGPVEIGPGCRIHPSARLEAGPGRLVLGPGCHVGAGARLVAGPGLTLGAGCFVEAGAVIGGPEAATAIGPACLVAAESRIAAGSRLGALCAVGPGLRIAGSHPDGSWLLSPGSDHPGADHPGADHPGAAAGTRDGGAAIGAKPLQAPP
jgi:hypothetical protein